MSLEYARPGQFGGQAKTYSLDIKDVAARYGVSVPTIRRKLAADPDFPQPLRFSSQTHRWAAAELDAYDARQTGRVEA